MVQKQRLKENKQRKGNIKSNGTTTLFFTNYLANVAQYPHILSALARQACLILLFVLPGFDVDMTLQTVCLNMMKPSRNKRRRERVYRKQLQRLFLRVTILPCYWTILSASTTLEHFFCGRMLLYFVQSVSILTYMSRIKSQGFFVGSRNNRENGNTQYKNVGEKNKPGVHLYACISLLTHLQFYFFYTSK